eukprot:TRINITY_DN4586_c0_g1_i1.p1 TRINITY_DN4586_c0_g1~~TRINITY_DN4586_c0_g1_i1.p1  ORF type:complete len:538 (-),score=90.94 TRINITY_DN4586_c0_g1_i1:39-1652(-)
MDESMLGRAPTADLVISNVCRLYQDLQQDWDPVFSEDRTRIEAFLEGVTLATSWLGLKPASRAYRSRWTVNYRALFPDERQRYKVEILQAALEASEELFLNGKEYKFSHTTEDARTALNESWASICIHLEGLQIPEDTQTPAPKPELAEFLQELYKLDSTWADFEGKYINDLIEFERQAKYPLLEAIEAERHLSKFEENPWRKKQGLQCPEYRHRTRALISSLAKLNLAVHPHRKGVRDLSVDVDKACNFLMKCAADNRAEDLGDGKHRDTARVIYQLVIQSLHAMRRYLREVEKCLEKVDSHLESNNGLVERLMDLEESWGICARYVQNKKLFAGLCDLVAQIKCAQTIVPSLASMCEACDAEVFLVIPRIAWLRALMEPSAQLPVLRHLLPNRFLDDTDQSSKHALSEAPCRDMWRCDVTVASCVQEFELTLTTLTGGPTMAWELLARRAVNGTHEAEDDKIFETLAPGRASQAKTAVNSFMIQLEALSIELQRHEPEKWNEFVGIVLQCVAGGSDGKGFCMRGADGPSDSSFTV